MKKIKIIGERGIFRYRRLDTNEPLDVIVSLEEHDRRITDKISAGEKIDPPKREGYKWVSASRITHFDSPNGFINEDEYAIEDSTGRVLLRVPGKRFFNMSKEEVKSIKQISDDDLV